MWHWGSAGFGFETNASSWAWRVSSGEIVNDVSIDGGYGFAAYGNGLVYGNISDDEETKHLLDNKEVVAVSSKSSQWIAIQGGDAPSLWAGDVVSDESTEYPLLLDLPSTIIDWKLQQDETSLYLRVEGLLEVTHYKRSIDEMQDLFVEIDAQEWPTSETTSSSVCLGSGVDYNATHAWCIEAPGLVQRSIDDGSIQSIRLPILSDAGGFGTLPQMFFALDGDASALMVDAGELRIGERLQDMTQVSNGTLSASGLFQYAFGSDESLNLNITGSFVEDERLSSSRSWTQLFLD